jgi:type IV secretion system protein VirB2
MESKNKMLFWTMAVVCGWAFAFPQLALASGAPWETALETIVSYMTGSTAHLLAIMAVAGIGVAMLAGQMSLRAALSVIIGIAVIFGAATIVGMFGG